MQRAARNSMRSLLGRRVATCRRVPTRATSAARYFWSLSTFHLSKSQIMRGIESKQFLLKKNYVCIPEAHEWASISTQEATNRVKELLSRTNDPAALSEAEKASLQGFCQEIFRRADASELASQLFLATFLVQDPESSYEAYIWFKRAAEEHKDPYALFALGSILLNGNTSLISTSSLETTKPYYIDTDRLDEFLGANIGVSPDGPAEGSAPKFEFRKWLKAERRRLNAEKKKAAGIVEEAPAGGGCASHGEKIPVEKFDGERMMLESADMGCVEAILTLGSLYLDPESTVLQFAEEKGVQFLLRAASEHQSATAYYLIGNYLFQKEQQFGVVGEQPSIRFFERAAELGDVDAMHFLGVAYHQGIEGLLEQDATKAVEYLEKAGRKNHAESLYHLGLMYRTGDGVEVNSELAVSHLKHAADLQHADAMFLLGEMYFAGSDGLEVDYPRALRLFKMAGKLGHGEALHNLGVMYFNGFGTPVDYEKAFYAYQNASVYQHVGAIENLADMYEHGYGVPQSTDNANYYRMRVKELRAAASGKIPTDENGAIREAESAKVLLDMLNEASKAAEKAKAEANQASPDRPTPTTP